jgi:hypothetical protein
MLSPSLLYISQVCVLLLDTEVREEVLPDQQQQQRAGADCAHARQLCALIQRQQQQQ